MLGWPLLQARLWNQQLDEQNRSHSAFHPTWPFCRCPLGQCKSLPCLTKEQLSRTFPVRGVLGKAASQSGHCPAPGGSRHIADIVDGTLGLCRVSALWNSSHLACYDLLRKWIIGTILEFICFSEFCRNTCFAIEFGSVQGIVMKLGELRGALGEIVPIT